MRCRKAGLLRLQLSRAFGSKMLPYVLLVSLAVVVISFVQSCLMFWGHDWGALPSAATMWVGNGRRANAYLIGFFVLYLLFPLAASIFGDSLHMDGLTHASYLLASRSSRARYLFSGLFSAWLVAFLAVLVVMLASQAIAFAAFPAVAGQDAYMTMVDVAATSRLQYGPLEEVPFSGLLFGSRLAYNLLYCLYDAFWAATMAGASYAISPFVHGNRLVVLGTPTVLFLAVSAAMPPELRFAGYLLPPYGTVSFSEVHLLAAPLLALIAVVACTCVALHVKRDVAL